MVDNPDWPEEVTAPSFPPFSANGVFGKEEEEKKVGVREAE